MEHTMFVSVPVEKVELEGINLKVIMSGIVNC